MNYGEKLKELREEKGLKIYDISRFLNFDKDTYGKYEREYNTIPIIHLNTLCNYFNVSLDYIFNISNIKQDLTKNIYLLIEPKGFLSTIQRILEEELILNDIKNYELLLDDMVVREKRSNRKSLLTANKTSCYQMNLRVTTSDRVFLIPIIEKTAFITLYSSTSNIFMENRDFADKLVNLLDDLDEKMLNGEI